jgi:hypothetical protein
VIFFEIIGIIILNTLCSLAVAHCFMRNALLSGVECVAKSRNEVMKMKESERNEYYETLREKNRKIDEKKKAKQEAERAKMKKKEENKQLGKEEKEKLKLEKERLKEEKKIKKDKEEKAKNKVVGEKSTSATAPPADTTKDVATTASDSDDTKPSATSSPVAPKTAASSSTVSSMGAKSATKPAPKKNGAATKQDDIKNLSDDELEERIKEQKKILRKKLETIRRNAFITRKPEEIEKAEKTIRDILEKHNLTEEMLQDDYEA